MRDLTTKQRDALVFIVAMTGRGIPVRYSNTTILDTASPAVYWATADALAHLGLVDLLRTNGGHPEGVAATDAGIEAVR